MKKLSVLIFLLTVSIFFVGCNGIKPNASDSDSNEKNISIGDESSDITEDKDVGADNSNQKILTLAEVYQCTKEELDEKLIGILREDLLSVWGEPDGILSGFWGEIWKVDKEISESVIVYYNNDGRVEEIKIKNLS
ncbi:MAG: hypothetical protein E7672_05060 [Ruminococcaceae bacterium]|nr:hypothetical protein [Oscillospiraceae bacterium]